MEIGIDLFFPLGTWVWVIGTWNPKQKVEMGVGTKLTEKSNKRKTFARKYDLYLFDAFQDTLNTTHATLS